MITGDNMTVFGKKQRVLVLGSSGMLGNAITRFFVERGEFDIIGTVRMPQSIELFPKSIHPYIIPRVDVENFDSLVYVLGRIKPDIVINCIGLVKQIAEAADPLIAVPINTLLPHRLAKMCAMIESRLIHFSTDCVFSGNKGAYVENDFPDARDLYGRTKFLGEVDYPNAITLRTSIIGHELVEHRSLIGWFIAQKSDVKGFKRAIFSGLPTVEMARIIHDFVIPNRTLRGVYHVSADPISKYELLRLVAKIYRKKINIVPDSELVIDRSLDSTRFRTATGFLPLPWEKLIVQMNEFH